MDGYSVDETHHSVPLVRVMAFDVEHITCGTLSSLSEGVSPTTSVFIDSVMHASCYACNSMPITLVILCLNASRRLLKVSCAVHSFMLLRSQGRLKRRKGQCPQMTPKKAGGSMPSGDSSKWRERLVHCPRAPTLEPSKEGHRPKNRHSERKGKVVSCRPRASRSSSRMGGKSGRLCLVCVSLLCLLVALVGRSWSPVAPGCFPGSSGTPLRTTLLSITCLLYFACLGLRVKGWR